MAKRRLKRVLIILGVPLALFLLVLLAADTAFVKKRLLAAADRALRAELGLSLTAGGSTLRPLRLSATLRDVRVAPVAPAAGPLRSLTASEIYVDLAWSTLFKGDLRIQEIRIVRPRLEALAPGESQAPSPPADRPAEPPEAGAEPAAPLKPFTFEIGKLSILDGAVAVGGSGQALTFDLDAIRLDLGLIEAGPDHRAALRTRGGRISLDGRPLEIRTLEADLVLDAGRIEIERLLLATPLSRFEIKGRVTDYQSAPALDLVLSAALALEEATALLPGLPPAHGTIAVDGAFKGTPEAGAASIAVRADSLTVEGYPEAALALTAESDLRTLSLKELELVSSSTRIFARGRIRLPGTGPSELDLTWTGLDLSLFSSFLPDLPPLDAVSSGQVEASWSEYELASVRASGRASFRSLSQAASTAKPVPPIPQAALLAAPPAQPETASPPDAPGSSEPPDPSIPAPRRPLPFDGDIAFTASRDGLEISRADLRAAGSELTLSGSMAWEGALRGRFDLAVPDLAAAVQAAAALTGPSEELPALHGQARIEGTIEGRADAPVVRAELAASGLAWNGLTVDSLDASFALDGPAVDVTRFEARLADGLVEGRFALRPANEQWPGGSGAPGPGLVFDASAAASGLDLAFLSPFLPEAPPSGRIAFEAEGRGPLDRPAFSLRLEGWNVGAAGARIPALTLSAESDGSEARARLQAALSAGAPAPLVIEAALPLAPPYPLRASLRTEGLVIDDFLVRSEGPVQEPAAPALRAPSRPLVPLTAEGTFLVPLEELSGSSFSLTVRSLDLGGLAAMTGAEVPPTIGGQADISVRASGDPTRPDALTLEGEIGRLTFSGDLPALETRGPARFSLRDGVFELEELALAAGDSSLRVSGSVSGLATAEPELAVRAAIDLDASLIPPGLINASIGGRLELDAAIDGPAARPVVRGRGGLSSGFFQLRDFPLTLSDLGLRLELRDRTILVTDGKGLANGGLLSLSGRIDLGEGPGFGRAALEAGLEGFRLNFPPGLITLSDGKARLEGDGRTWLLSGDLRILQGSFREDIFPGAELLGFSSLPLLPEGEEPSAAAYDFKLDVRAATVEPIVVRNNMADFALEANVRVTGSLAAPLLTGRVRNVSVGEIVFGERRYTLETLRLEFLGQPVPDPQVDILAHTRMLHRMEDLEIQLRLSGPASDLKFSLTSTPPRSSQDLSLLLLTGRSLDEVRGSALDTLKGQMVLHFTSPLLSPVTRSLERFLGVDDISFVPMSIASEEDPGARLTFVKRLSDQLALTYSVDVTQTERQSWIMDYSLSRKFAVRGYKKDDGSYGGSFRHTVPLWAEKDDRARPREILVRVGVEGEEGGGVRAEGEAEQEGVAGEAAAAADAVAGTEAGAAAAGARLDRRLLEKAWKPLRTGRPFRVSDLGRAVDNLHRLYREKGFADAAITPVVRRDEGERDGESGAARVSVAFRIEPGEPAVFDFRGDRIPAKLRRKVLTAWTGKLPEAANLATAREIVSGELRRKRYYRAEVTAESLPAPEGGVKTYAIETAKNGRYAVRGFDVAGNAAVDDPVIRKAASDFPLADSRGLWNVVHQQRLALRSVRRAYEERGYTKAEIEVRSLREDREARRIDIVLGVVEGPRSVVRSVAFEGHDVVSERDLRAALEMREGRPFDPGQVAEERTALLNLYRGRGYQSATVTASASATEAEGGGGEDIGDIAVAIVYTIDEGPRHTISAVDVEGERRTGERFIRGASGLKAGRPLTSEGLAMGQKRIYDTRIFRSVNIEGGGKGGEAADRRRRRRRKGREWGRDAEEGERAAGGARGADEVRERVGIEVREMPPVTLSYGLRYNSEEKIEGFGEIDLRSPFGDGLAGVLAYRRNARQSDLRFSVESNYILGVRFNLLSTVYTKRDVRELFTADDTGLTLQSRFDLPSKANFSALYRMNRIHTYDPLVPGSAIEDKVFVSEIGGLLLRDTRDDLLDPRRGSFLSVAVTWSPEFLATGMPYVSVFGQYQNYHRFGPGLVWAAAARVGMADAFGRELVAAKRFFAGGGTSVRGFKQDGVGPVDPLLGVPAGGAAVVVVNQELRFPIFGPASGAVFYDLGAVYPTLREIRLGDVRHGMGVGLRMMSPVGLVRADYGFNPWPRPGEKRSVLYLSIGQAF
jgi:outer membrane protein assembly factor BamA